MISKIPNVPEEIAHRNPFEYRETETGKILVHDLTTDKYWIVTKERFEKEQGQTWNRLWCDEEPDQPPLSQEEIRRRTKK